MEPAVKVALIERAGTLASVVIVLTAVIGILVAFRSEIRAALDHGNVAVKAFGVEVAIKNTRQAAVAIEKASRSRTADVGPIAQLADRPQTLRLAERPENASKLEGKRILWVDDHPENNVYETQAFLSVGINVTMAVNNQDAEYLLQHSRFDAVVTDISRGEKGDPEGLDTISIASGCALPVIVYSGPASERLFPEALRKGAIMATFDPSRLFDAMIVSLLAE